MLSLARALPAIADAVRGDLTILADSGVRSGLDVAHLLDLIASEMRVAMTLTGARALGGISRESLVRAGRAE